MVFDIVFAWLEGRGVLPGWAKLVADLASVGALLVCAWLANWVAKAIILRSVHRLVQRTSFVWDDVFLRCGVFGRLSHIAPALVVTLYGSYFLRRTDLWVGRLETAVNVYLVVILMMVISALLNSAAEIYNRAATGRRVPLKGFTQSAKLLTFLFGSVVILGLILNRSPLYFLSGLGALTAVLLLIFKDALLGLVAGVQISVNQLVQIGDWIEMPKYEADGDVIDVSLTTVKVQNWDKTITTVPSYALISEPVKNWRGMEESGGRRIKRALFLDMESFRFVDDALLERMLTFARLRPYLEQKLPELKAYNELQTGDLGVPPNGRRLTNVGCFRAYVNEYLLAHPKIQQEMTLLVRQLAPTDKGLPLEIYAFTNDTRWAAYEGIQADIFDHLLTVLPQFELRVFQSPTGNDLKGIGSHSERRSLRPPARASSSSPAS
ncbi:MAG: hypothetical protein RL685_104 [Pseudomonadota bacterium]|jgi:miniconductance mechanosensitive channel